MSKELKKMLLSNRRYIVPYAEGMQDQIQQQYFSFDDQIKRLNLLKSLPYSKAVQLQIDDITRQINKTADYMRRTGQSFDYTKSENDAIINEAKLIEAKDIVHKNEKQHKLVDLVNEQQLQNDKVTAMNQSHIGKELLRILTNPLSDNILLHNLQSLLREQSTNLKGPSEAMMNNGIADGFSDSIIQYEKLTDDPPELSQPKKEIHPVELKAPVQQSQQVLQEDLAHKVSNLKNISTADDMRLHLMHSNALNKNGKIKSKQKYMAIKRDILKEQQNTDQKKKIKELLNQFSK